MNQFRCGHCCTCRGLEYGSACGHTGPCTDCSNGALAGAGLGGYGPNERLNSPGGAGGMYVAPNPVFKTNELTEQLLNVVKDLSAEVKALREAVDQLCRNTSSFR